MFIMSGAVFGDHYGRRLGYIVGIVVFCLASVACGLAPNIAAHRCGAWLQGHRCRDRECGVARIGQRRVYRSPMLKSPGDRNLDGYRRDRPCHRPDA